MTSQLKRQGLEGSPVQETLSLWSWGAPPHQHVDVFANLEALQALQFKNFLETSSCRHD